jgi:hypothetical protein
MRFSVALTLSEAMGMIRKIAQKMRATNSVDVPRHKIGFYSFIVMALSAAVALVIVL